MAEITQRLVESQAEWEAFIASHAEANFLQSWYWGEVYRNLNREVTRLGFYAQGRLVGVMLAIVEPARRGRYLTVPGGPIIDWANSALVDEFTTALRRLAKEQACVFVRVRPQLTNSQTSRGLFKARGFKPAPMHLHAELTSQLDITLGAEKLRQQMRKNTRYELKRAKKLNIRVSSTSNPAAIKQFYDLQLKTAKRHGFVPYGYKFLYEQFRVFATAEKALLYSAHSAEGELIAQAYVIFYGVEAAYHYGASTELGRKLPGAYLIQWQAILEAQRRGLKRYNFWGVVGENETKHRFYGVSVFKRGFRGQDVEYLHAHDLVIKPLGYLVNWLVEIARKKIRHL